MTITLLTKEREKKVNDNCSSLLQSNKSITIIKLAQTIVTLVAAFTAVPMGQLLYRHQEKVSSILNHKLTGKMLNIEHFSVIISIPCCKPPFFSCMTIEA